MAALPSGQPVCGSCGAVFPQRFHVGPIVVAAPDGPMFPGPPKTWPYTPAEYERASREAGWKVGRGVTYGGYPYDDALCPRCARPDPKLVALCHQLAPPVVQHGRKVSDP